MDCFQKKQAEFGSDWSSILSKNTVTKNALDANCSWIVAESPHSMLLNHVFMDTVDCWMTPDSTFLKLWSPRTGEMEKRMYPFAFTSTDIVQGGIICSRRGRCRDDTFYCKHL